MVCSHCSGVSFKNSTVRSVRWVAYSATGRSSKANRLSMISFSSGSITPFWLPASTSIRISSSLTPCPSSSGSTPHRRSTPLVEAVSTATIGANRCAITVMGPDMPSASCSARFIASRLGTSSPQTSVR